MMEPKKALETMCYTSERKWAGTIYTISDIRFPEYNGRQIIIILEHGKNIAKWINQ